MKAQRRLPPWPISHSHIYVVNQKPISLPSLFPVCPGVELGMEMVVDILRSIDHDVPFVVVHMSSLHRSGTYNVDHCQWMVETETVPLPSFDAVPLEPTLSRWSQRSALKETARLHACCCPPFALLRARGCCCHSNISMQVQTIGTLGCK